jgi:hypothetical protein
MLDAISWPEWSGDTRLYVSTTGTAKVTSADGQTVSFADEDIGQWGLSPERWIEFYDASTVKGLSKEDTIAMSVNTDFYDDNDYYYYYTFHDLVIAGSGVCGSNPRVRVTQKDIFRNTIIRIVEQFDQHNTYWEVRNCDLMWHGPDHGWNYNIDAIEYPRKH